MIIISQVWYLIISMSVWVHVYYPTLFQIGFKFYTKTQKFQTWSSSTLWTQGWAKLGLQLGVYKIQFILVLLLIDYCVIYWY